MVTAACRLTKLERIEIWEATFDHLFLLAGQAVKLDKIKVKFNKESGNKLHFRGIYNVINLVALNEERFKLERARKLTIYVEEDVYLRTKWIIRDIDLNMIRLK